MKYSSSEYLWFKNRNRIERNDDEFEACVQEQV